MAEIVSSTFYESLPEPDGRRSVKETYTLGDGTVLEYSWLGAQDIALVMQARQETLLRLLKDREDALALVQGTELPLSKLEFRRKFTLLERQAIDTFNLKFETIPEVPEQYKAALRTIQKDFEGAGAIHLKNPDTIAALELYVILGLLSPDRKQEIIYG